MRFRIKEKQLDNFLSRFDAKDRGDIVYLLYGARKKLNLPMREVDRFIFDYMKAIIYLNHIGKSVPEILEALDYEKLGDFYSAKDERWYPLDNAAKVYPLSMSSRWMAMFRLSCYLKENVNAEVLQMALSFTIKRFPYFAASIKKGVFWHYLDGMTKRFDIQRENMRPLTAMKLSKGNELPFRVIYYKNRISVECFHIVTDGTGGMIFLKTLVGEYLRILGAKFEYDEGVLDISKEPDKCEWANDFDLVGEVESPKGFTQPSALRMNGKMSKFKPYRVYHFEMSAIELKRVAKERGMTITAYLLEKIVKACNVCTKQKGEKKIQIQVPKNMRDYYPSKTLRNYSMYGVLKFTKEEAMSEGLSEMVKAQLVEETSKEFLSKMMASANNIVRTTKFIPRILKNLIVRPVYGIMGDRSMTNTLSNVGVVKFPEGMKKHIEKMDCVLGPTITNGATTALVTMNDVTVLSITKMVADTSFEDVMYSLITKDGINIDVKGSMKYESRHKLSKHKQ